MKKLKIQDFISIGIYTAIYFLVICLVLLVLRLLVPVFSSVFIPGGTALFAGIVYLLVLQRVPRFGALTIMSSVIGLFFLVSGHFPMAFVPSFLFGFLADCVMYKTPLPEKVRTVFSYIVFSFGLTGPIFPLWFMKDAYIASLTARGKDAAYIQRVFAPITQGMLLIVVLSIILGALAGIWLGYRLYRKHFDKEKAAQYG